MSTPTNPFPKLRSVPKGDSSTAKPPGTPPDQPQSKVSAPPSAPKPEAKSSAPPATPPKAPLSPATPSKENPFKAQMKKKRESMPSQPPPSEPPKGKEPTSPVTPSVANPFKAQMVRKRESMKPEALKPEAGEAPPAEKEKKEKGKEEGKEEGKGAPAAGGGGMLGVPQETAEPKSPLAPQRVIPQLKSDREEVEVLPPEERRRLAREASMAPSEAIIPKLQPERPEADVLPPEERRRLAGPYQQGERVVPVLPPSRPEADVLPPEERLRIHRESMSQLHDSMATPHDDPLNNTRTRISGKPSSNHGTPGTAALDVTTRSRGYSQMSKATTPRTLLPQPQTPTVAPTSPHTGPCPNCDQLRAQIADLERRLQEALAEKDALQGERGQKKEVKKLKEELSKREKKLKALESKVGSLEDQLQAARDAQQSQGGDVVSREAHEATVAALNDQIKTLHEHLEIDATEDGASSEAPTATGPDEELSLLHSQIWSLETALEFRSREIDRLNNMMHEFVQQVEILDHELAEAMRKLMAKNQQQARDDEVAALGAPINDAVAEMKTKREAKKEGRKRRRKRGKLARELEESREEAENLRDELSRLRRQMMDRGMSLPGGQGGQGGGGGLSMATLLTHQQGAGGHRPGTCCFKAAFVAAGQAEAKVAAAMSQKDAAIKNLQHQLDKAHKAIAATAGIGHNNELKLQQARKALQCILDSPAPTAAGSSPATATPQKAAVGSAAPVAVPTMTSPGATSPVVVQSGRPGLCSRSLSPPRPAVAHSPKNPEQSPHLQHNTQAVKQAALEWVRANQQPPPKQQHGLPPPHLPPQPQKPQTTTPPPPHPTPLQQPQQETPRISRRPSSSVWCDDGPSVMNTHSPMG